MDNKIRINEICSIGLPRCDFVFSSTRSCFIAYGFEESTLEMTIIRNILEKEGVQAIEAGGFTTPGENAFCAKICSKIITSQFCIVLLNNDIEEGKEIPNANINMEYGLMLGFNKYVIPFQKNSQKLPFNVAGLDTIKYTSSNLEEEATKIIKQAIVKTQQEENPVDTSGQYIRSFFLKRNLLVSPIDSEGERNLYRLGEPVGFDLAVDFSGMSYTYVGHFSSLRLEVVVWRIKKLIEILNERRGTITERIGLNSSSLHEINTGHRIFDTASIIVLVTSDKDKESIENIVKTIDSNYEIEVVSMDQIHAEFSDYIS